MEKGALKRCVLERGTAKSKRDRENMRFLRSLFTVDAAAGGIAASTAPPSPKPIRRTPMHTRTLERCYQRRGCLSIFHLCCHPPIFRLRNRTHTGPREARVAECGREQTAALNAWEKTVSGAGAYFTPRCPMLNLGPLRARKYRCARIPDGICY